MSDAVRVYVWNGLLDAGRQVRYYTHLFSRHASFQAWVDNALALSGGIGIVSLLVDVWSAGPAVMGGISAALAVYSRIAKHADKAAQLNTVRSECADVENRLDELWTRVQGGLVVESDALEEALKLNQWLSDATGKAAILGIPEDSAANKAAWIDAIRAKEGQYAQH